jgi:hypothetical protein
MIDLYLGSALYTIMLLSVTRRRAPRASMGRGRRRLSSAIFSGSAVRYSVSVVIWGIADLQLPIVAYTAIEFHLRCRGTEEKFSG